MTIPSFSDESPATQSNIAIADYRGDRRPSLNLTRFARRLTAAAY